jgi:hypothetical protein
LIKINKKLHIENQPHHEPTNPYENFWNRFREKENWFSTAISSGVCLKDFELDLFDLLDVVHAGISFRYGTIDDDSTFITFTSAGKPKHIFFVEELVRHAPAIPGWAFFAMEQEGGLENLHIASGRYLFDSDTLSYYPNEDPTCPDEIGITIVYKHYQEEYKKEIENAVRSFLDCYLGELIALTVIDRLQITGGAEARPIEGLKEYVQARHGDITTKYKRMQYDLSQCRYCHRTEPLADEYILQVDVDENALDWEGKPSYPWILNVELYYEKADTPFLPDKNMIALFEEFINEIKKAFGDTSSFISIGRVTAIGTTNLYFACKDFKKPSQIMHDLINKYEGILEADYDIYKDRYWRSIKGY